MENMDDKVATILADNEAESQLEHLCRLDFEKSAKHRRLTSIVCTISRTRSHDILEKMILEGMNIARFNFSHDSHQHHAATLEQLDKAIQHCSLLMGYNYHIGLAIDIKGPEIRTGGLENTLVNEVEVRTNEFFKLSINRDLMEKGTRDLVYVDYPNIINVVPPGTLVYLNDGAIKLVVKEVAVDCLLCLTEIGGKLGPRKSVHIPGLQLDLPNISERDAYDLNFAMNNKFDFVFAMVRDPQAYRELRTTLGERGKDMKIILKIDSIRTLLQLDEFIKLADGILIDRGDLGVELPMEKVFLVQKAIIAHCNKAGRPVICATQILESMRHKGTPYRSDVVDLGNAVIDGADGIMLSSETATGKHPIEVVATTAKVCLEAESVLWHRNLYTDLLQRNPAVLDAQHAISISAIETAKKCHAAAIIVLTTSGRSAHIISRYKPNCPVMAVTRCSRTARQCHLYRGLIPLFYNEPVLHDWLKDVDARLQFALNVGKVMNIVKMGDAVVLVSPWVDGTGFTNNLRIAYAFYEKEHFECQLKRDTKTLPERYSRALSTIGR